MCFVLHFYENFKLGNLYELDVGDQLIVFSLLLNVLKLTSYMEEEINAPRENNNNELFGVDTFELCQFVYDLTKNRNSLCWLTSELSNFYLKLFKVVYGTVIQTCFSLRWSTQVSWK